MKTGEMIVLTKKGQERIKSLILNNRGADILRKRVKLQCKGR